MAYVIKIGTSKDITTAIQKLKYIKKRIPKLSSDIMKQWGETLERDTKNAAIQAGIKNHTGELLNSGIKWRQRPNGRTGYLFIRDYGIKLDSMSPHWTSITPNRTRFLAWGLQAQNSSIRAGARGVAAGKKNKAGRVAYSVYVKPHPFIKAGYARARKKLRPMIKQQLPRLTRNV